MNEEVPQSGVSSFFCVYDEPSADLCLHKDLHLVNVHHRAVKRDDVIYDLGVYNEVGWCTKYAERQFLLQSCTIAADHLSSHSLPSGMLQLHFH